MRQAIGGTFIVNLIAIFLAVMIALLIGSMGYSKAYKVKNNIIYIIEKYDGWGVSDSSGNNIVKQEVESTLRSIGYPLNLRNSECKNRPGGTKLYPVGSMERQSYHYCIHQFNTSMGYYYGVTTYMHFDIPLIGGFLEFPVYGETKVMYDTSTHITY